MFNPNHFNPGSIEEALEFLPRKCRLCETARDIIALAFQYNSVASELGPALSDITKNCSGYRPEFELDIEAAVKLPQEQRRAVIVSAIEQTCPYKMLQNQPND